MPRSHSGPCHEEHKLVGLDCIALLFCGSSRLLGTEHAVAMCSFVLELKAPTEPTTYHLQPYLEGRHGKIRAGLLLLALVLYSPFALM